MFKKTDKENKENRENQINSKDVFATKEYAQNLNETKKFIKDKSKSINNKLSILNTQAEFVEKVINKKQIYLESIPENNYTAIGKINNSIVFQMDINSKIHDNILKYENLLQGYIKYLMDIENNKLTAYTKIEALKNDETLNNKEYISLMKDVHDMVNVSSAKDKNNKVGNIDIAENAIQELKLGGYGESFKTK